MADPVSTQPSSGVPLAPPPIDLHTPGSGQPGALVNAQTLIQQATDPVSKRVDTHALAVMTVDAMRANPAVGHSAREEIEAALFARNAGDASRYIRDVHDLASHPLPVPEGLSGAAQGMVSAGTRTLINNPILSVTWQSTLSPWTGRGGFTAGATTMLQGNGIIVAPRVNAIPPGSVGPTAGLAPAQANNINGAAARDAIANDLCAQGMIVRTEVPVQGGQRIVDVQARTIGADPRMAQQVEIESKLGRTSNSATKRGQAALDAERMAANQIVRRGGAALEVVGKVVRPVAIVLDAVQVGQAFRADGNRIGENTGRAVSGVAGGAAGGWGGAVGGAAIGTAIFPGVGTVIGGVVGAGLGAWGGDSLARGAFDTVRGWFR